MPSLLLSLPSAPEPPNYVNIALEPTYTVQKPNTPLDGLAPQGATLHQPEKWTFLLGYCHCSFPPHLTYWIHFLYGCCT